MLTVREEGGGVRTLGECAWIGVKKGTFGLCDVSAVGRSVLRRCRKWRCRLPVKSGSCNAMALPWEFGLVRACRNALRSHLVGT